MATKDVESKFEDGKTYIFQNIQYGLDCLEINGTQMDAHGGPEGAMIDVWANASSANQKWRADLDDENDPPLGHKLVTPYKDERNYVVTMLSKRQNFRVVLQEFTGAPGQLWALVPCTENSSYQIVNAENGKALEAYGRVKNARCTEFDPNDLHQQWKALPQ